MSLFSFQDIITATTGILILLALVLAISVIIQGANSSPESEIADQKTIELRNDLLEEVRQLQIQSKKIAGDAATWISSTPAELQKKIDTQSMQQRLITDDIASAKKMLHKLMAMENEGDFSSDLQVLTMQLKGSSQSLAEVLKQINELKTSNRVVYNFREANRSAWLVEVSGKNILAAKIGSNDKPQRFDSPLKFNRFAAGLPRTQQYFVLAVKPSGIAAYDQVKPYLLQIKADTGIELVGENQTVIDPAKGAGF
jgi:hypothetical protein